MIIDVSIMDGHSVRLPIPDRGYYVECKYVYDEHASKIATYGPFPENKKHLLIEFLNLLEEMVTLCQADKNKVITDEYWEIENYSKWFNQSQRLTDGTPDDVFRHSMDMKPEYWPGSDDNQFATLESFDCIYRDGLTYHRYGVGMLRTKEMCQ